METRRADEPQYVLITGKGRSGTTWLARLMATYGRCVYKHEPFLEGKKAPFLDWRDSLLDSDAEALREQFSELVHGCQFGVDQPPFQQPGMRRANPEVLRRLYQLGSKVPATRPLFEYFGRPVLTGRDAVLMKDVNFPNELLPRLCEVIRPHLISIVRNPFSNIASHFKGVEAGLFARVDAADIARVAEIIDMPGYERFAPYRNQLAELPAAAFEALRWRIQTEPLVEFTQQYDPGRIVVYERLCEDAGAVVGEIFAELGWPVGDATRDFIHETTEGPRRERTSRRAYFSVYRTPAESLHKWKEQLSAEAQSDIASVFRESPIKELWPELLLDHPAA